jgi:hypothetical protein
MAFNTFGAQAPEAPLGAGVQIGPDLEDIQQDVCVTFFFALDIANSFLETRISSYLGRSKGSIAPYIMAL